MQNTPSHWLEMIQNTDGQVAGFIACVVLLAAYYFGAFSEPPTWIIPSAWFGAAFLGFMICLKIFVVLYDVRADRHQRSHP
jgi:hypothetical protein